MFAKANDIAGPTSLISKNATDADKKLAAKLILTYTKTPAGSEGSVTIGDEVISAAPFENKSYAQQYFVVK